jgi:hypothetical protein
MPSTLSDTTSAYTTIASADGKSRRTIEWVTSSARYYQSLLGDGATLE